MPKIRPTHINTRAWLKKSTCPPPTFQPATTCVPSIRWGSISLWMLLFFLLSTDSLSAQKSAKEPVDTSNSINRYLVYFKDKGDVLPTPTSAPLSLRARQRRARQNISLNQKDVLVYAPYIDGLRKIKDVQVYHPSRWLNAVLVQTTPRTLAQIKALSYVKTLRLVAPKSRLRPHKDKESLISLLKHVLPIHVLRKKKNSPKAQVFNSEQNNLLGIDEALHPQCKGKGMRIAVLDAGFAGVNEQLAFYRLFEENRLKDIFDFVRNRKKVFRSGSRKERGASDHGTCVLSIMAADLNFFRGIAPKAEYLLYATEDGLSEYRVEEYNWVVGAERADSLGADIIQSSLGYDTFDADTMNYDKEIFRSHQSMISLGAKWAAERGILVVVAAGNNGAGGLGAPADTPEVLSVGAVNAFMDRAGFSSMGPKPTPEHKQIKPDVAAPGAHVLCFEAEGISISSGTSMAAPFISGLAACVWPLVPHLSPDSLATYIRQSGHQAIKPDRLIGYGVPHAKRLLEALPKLQFQWSPTNQLLTLPTNNPIRPNYTYTTSSRFLRIQLPPSWKDIQLNASLTQTPADTLPATNTPPIHIVPVKTSLNNSKTATASYADLFFTNLQAGTYLLELKCQYQLSTSKVAPNAASKSEASQAQATLRIALK